MALNENPGALAGATGAGLPCYAIAAGNLTIAFCPFSGNAFARGCVSFAALDPANIAVFWLAGVQQRRLVASAKAAACLLETVSQEPVIHVST